jgi:hypothetical protein
MRRFITYAAAAGLAGAVIGSAAWGGTSRAATDVTAAATDPAAKEKDPVVDDATDMVVEGRDIFRFDTFGSEAFWGGALQLHRAIAGKANGGVGPGLSPATALAVGLKVDSERVPPAVASALRAGKVDLNDPANTLALLQADAVVGVKGVFDKQGKLASVGIRCSLCHSTVDDSFAPGIGKRLDGWPNRDLNVGEVIALAPNLAPIATVLGLPSPSSQATQDAVRKVVRSWGPGKFDAELLMDGKIDGKPTVLPPAFGLAGVNMHTYTAWGSVTYWNAFVANLEMGGQGTFFDPRLDDAAKFPRAAANRFGHRKPAPGEPDLVTPKLAALHFYQLALKAPKPPAGSFNPGRARQGKALFEGKAKCAECHVPPIFTEPGWNVHTAKEIGIDDAQALRSPDEVYRTTPLGGLFTRSKGGFYHDGRFATLADVVNHYDATFGLGLTADEKMNLVEYLKSL